MQNIHPDKLRQFDGLTVSALGAGTYLGPADEATDKLYEQALMRAALSGINFFDTAINYRNQRSERIMGKVIRALKEKGISRNQLVIATKGGYLPFEGPSYEDYIRTHYIDTHIIEPKDIAAETHCMTPAYLENQIQTSLKHLGLSHIDLYYLHNPEIQLPEVGEMEFYQRLQKAFNFLQSKVEEGQIGRYGIATWNGFRQKKGALSLDRVLQCATPGFKAIQLPYNLVMLEAIKEKKIIESAAERGITIMASAPLMQGYVCQISKRVFEQLPFSKAPALEFILSTPHICTAFCGMKTLKHVEENSQILQEPNWSYEEWLKACRTVGVKMEQEA